ncbi:MAG: alcohol dehydrogenase catalytic domain-containing protein [Thermaerobacterales bacterium]
MRQAFLDGQRQLRLRHIERPVPGPDEVLVEIDVSLTCGTDLKTFRRGHSRLPVPGPLGHEGSGRIAAIGDQVAGFKPGQAVMWLPTAPCETCPACRSGRENHCATLFDEVVLGVHGDYALLPGRIVRRHLFHRPPQIPAPAAALLEPLACVVRGWRRIERTMGLPLLPPTAGPASLDTLVVGGGPIGLMHVLLASGIGAVACVGARGRRGRLASEFGASFISAEKLSHAGVMFGEAGFGAFDLVIDCSGEREVWQTLPQMVRPGGSVLLFGGLAARETVTFDAARIHYDEVDLVGSFHYTTADALTARQILGGRHHQLASLITGAAPLADLVDVFACLDQGYDGGKIALYPRSDAEPAGWVKV